MKHQAILNLVPKAQFSTTHGEKGEDTITWLSDDIKQPSDNAIAQEMTRLEQEADTKAKQYAINQATEAEIFSVLGAEDKMGSVIAQLNVMGNAIRMINYKLVTGRHLPDAVEQLTVISEQQEVIKDLREVGRKAKANL